MVCRLRVSAPPPTPFRTQPFAFFRVIGWVASLTGHGGVQHQALSAAPIAKIQTIRMTLRSKYAVQCTNHKDYVHIMRCPSPWLGLPGRRTLSSDPCVCQSSVQPAIPKSLRWTAHCAFRRSAHRVLACWDPASCWLFACLSKGPRQHRLCVTGPSEAFHCTLHNSGGLRRLAEN